MLRAGGLGLLGIGLPDFFRLTELQASHSKRERSFGKAKSCILLYLYGSPSQLETFDMKPDAPVEIRGDFKPIRSSLPGLDVCELLPNTAKIMDRVTVLRSLTHPYPIHGVAYATTGVSAIDVPMELNPHDGRHQPFLGCVVDYLGRDRKKPGGVPDNIALPFPFSSRRTGEVQRAGPYAAYLGTAFNPLWTEFRGEPTRRIVKTLAGQTLDVAEPYVGIDAERSLRAGRRRRPIRRPDARPPRHAPFADGTVRPGTARSARRRRRPCPRPSSATGVRPDPPPKMRTALDLSREPMPLRESYGLTVFGQAALAARRLVEAGSRFVTVTWDEYGLAGSAWDTHWEHYPRMKNELMPGFDRGFHGLIADLDQRGLLDETLVLVLSEHGRTPKISSAKGGGRDHWSQAYSAVMAGAGIARGRVVGKTDKIAGTVAERPISPKEVLATVYHLLGIDPETLLYDRTNRPIPLVQNASVIAEALA